MMYPTPLTTLNCLLGPAALAVTLATTVSPASGQCGVPESGHCVIPHETAGCSDSACCTAVCNLDPFCCDVGWDEYCAGEAVDTCGIPAPIIQVMGFGTNTSLPGGVAVGPCDLAAFNSATGEWSVYFDGDDVGLTGQVIMAASRTAAGDLLIATLNDGSVAGLVGGPADTAFEPYDLIRFTPTSLGGSTAGSWTFHFDGSDVGMSGSLSRAIRSIAVLPDGSIAVVFRAITSLPGGLSVTPRDIARFQPTSLGSATAGTWSLYVQGSNIGLTTADERPDSISARADGSITFSTMGPFTVPGISGGASDLVRFIPTALGSGTAGSIVPVVSATAMSLPSNRNLRAGFEILIDYPDGPRPGSGGGDGGETPPTCGDPRVGACCVTSLMPYCSDASCCELVCAADPACCSLAWDEYCVAAATNQCASCMLPPLPVMAFGVATTLPGGLAVDPCDLASYDETANAWSVLLDGDDVGLAGKTIRAAARLPDGDLLLAMHSLAQMPGLVGGPNGNTYERFDVLRFRATSFGEVTAGTWSFHFDGSDVGLTGSTNMAIRSLSALPDGSLVFATTGNVTLPGVGSVTANDLVRFTPTSLGSETSGTWSMFLDGSDVGLTTANELLDGSFVTGAGTVLLSTRGSFGVTGLSGTGGDIFEFTPTSLGDATAGSFAMRFAAETLGIPSTASPQAVFLNPVIIDIGNRPLHPVLFDRLPSATVSAAAVEDGHAEYIIVYQGVDPHAASTGLINAQLVIDSIRENHGDNPSGYGVLDFESPFIERLEAGPGDPNWTMTVDTVVGALQALKAEFPQVKWSMYSMRLVRYWIDYTLTWADVPATRRESQIQAILTGFGPVLRECDWFNPTAYDRYELSTYSAGQQAAKTAQEVAYREAMVEVCNRFNSTSGLPRKPILPMVSPMFWKVGQISYNMKMISTEEILRDTVRPLMNEGADGVAFWTGLSYWVRAATSTQDLGQGQLDSRYAFMMDFYGGVAPADWTAPAVRADLELRISEHISNQLDEVRLGIYDLLFGTGGP